jgi:hypothetical protein
VRPGQGNVFRPAFFARARVKVGSAPEMDPRLTVVVSTLLIASGISLAILSEVVPDARAPWIISLTMCLLVYVFYVRLLSLTTWFLGSYFALFYFTPLVDALPALTSREAASTYAWLSILGIHLFLASYMWVQQRSPGMDGARDKDVDLDCRLLGYIGLVCCVVVLAVMFMSAGGINMAAFTRATRMQAKSIVASDALYLIYLVSLSTLAGLVVAPLWRRAKPLALACLTAGSLVSFYYFLLLRQRTHIATFFFAVVIGWLVFARNRTIGERPFDVIRTRPVSVALVAASVVLLVGSMFVVRIARGHIDVGGNPGQVLEMPVDDIVRYGTSREAQFGSDIGYTPTVLRILEVVPDTHDFLWGSSYYRPLTMLGDSESRPPETSRLVGSWYAPGTGLTRPPGFNGDAYLNFGMGGLAVFVLWGAALGMLDKRNTQTQWMLAAISFGVMFHFARGSFNNAVVGLAFLYVTLAVLVRIGKVFRLRNVPR